MIDVDPEYDPFDDDAPGNEPPGAVADIDYDPFDDDNDDDAAPPPDFTYYDSYEFISQEPAARSKFAALIEAAAQECPGKRSEIVSFIYREYPSLAELDTENLDDIVLSEIQKISDKAIRLSKQEYNRDQKEAAAARALWRADFREEMLATGRDLVEITHERGLALHDMDTTARALGMGWNWSSDKNRITRQSRGHRARPGNYITRGQAAAMAVDSSAPVAPVAYHKPASKSTFAKLVTVDNAPGAISDKSTFPDRGILPNTTPPAASKPAAGKSTFAAADDAPGMESMFKKWMAARGNVEYRAGQTRTELPAW